MQKKVLATAIAAAMCAPVVAEAVTVKFSGHVNRAIRFADDGVRSDVQHIDHGGSRTRMRWAGSQSIGGGNKAGAYTEIAVAPNVSGGAIKAAAGGNNFGIRHASVNFSGSWGRIDAGLTTNANAGTYTDMTGTSAYDPAGSNLILSTPFQATGGGGPIAIQTNNVFQSFTYGRDHLIKYTSPKIGPVQVAVDMDQNEQWAAQARLNTSFGGSKVSAKIGYRDEENQSGFDQWNISGGIKFSQGTSVSLSYSNRDFTAGGGLDSEYVYAKIGHSWGPNTVALGWYNSEDMAAAGDEGTEWSVTFLHKIPKARVHLYASYSNFDYDNPAAATEDVDMFLIGSRIFF